MEYTDAARLVFTAPSSVTLTAMRSEYNLGNGFDFSGFITDGILRFAHRTMSGDTQWLGELQGASRFSLSGTNEEGCPVRLRATRYEGPRMCDVTTEEEEAAIAAELREAVDASNLGAIQDCFIGERIFSLTYALMETQPGEYAQAGTAWSLTAPQDGFRFVFDDGSVLAFDAEKKSTTLSLPQGAKLTTVETPDDLRVSVDGQWSMVFDVSWLLSSPYSTSLIGPEAPTYTLRAYETPVGKLTWSETGHELHYTLGSEVRITKTEDVTTLERGDVSRTWTHAERDAYCPVPGYALYQAFPNLLQELVSFCATTPLYGDRVECMLVGP